MSNPHHNLQASLLLHDLVPHLIKVDLLAAPQTILQRLPNLDRLYGTRQLEGQLLVVENASRELVRFGDLRNVLKP